MRGLQRFIGIHRVCLRVVKNDKVSLLAAELFDRFEQLVTRTLELAAIVHAVRRIDHIHKRLAVAANAEELGRRLRRDAVAASPATTSFAAGAAAD